MLVTFSLLNGFQRFLVFMKAESLLFKKKKKVFQYRLPNMPHNENEDKYLIPPPGSGILVQKATIQMENGLAHQ